MASEEPDQGDHQVWIETQVLVDALLYGLGLIPSWVDELVGDVTRMLLNF